MSKRITEGQIENSRREERNFIAIFLFNVTAFATLAIMYRVVVNFIIQKSLWKATDTPNQWMLYTKSPSDLIMVVLPYVLILMLSSFACSYYLFFKKDGVALHLNSRFALITYAIGMIPQVLVFCFSIVAIVAVYESQADLIESHLAEEIGIEAVSSHVTRAENLLTVEGADGNVYLFNYSEEDPETIIISTKR